MNINHAVIEAFERSKTLHAEPPSTRLFTALLMALFFVALLAVLAMGTHVYGKVVEMKGAADTLHVQAGYMTNIVRMNDAASAVKRGEGPEGPALVLVETLETGVYETRIYRSDGMVVQEYAIAGREYNPSGATPLFASGTFDFSLEANLVTICTDAGTMNVALRSDGGGEA